MNKTINSKTEYYRGLIQCKLDAAKRDGTISRGEMQVLQKFENYQACRVCPQRMYKEIHYILKLKSDCGLPDVSTCDTDDAISAYSRIATIRSLPRGFRPANRNRDNTMISQNTICDMQRTAKIFYFWLSWSKINKHIDYTLICNIQPMRPVMRTIDETKILSAAQVRQIIDKSQLRYRAMFSVMYFAALRVGEVCDLRIKDIYGIGDAAVALQNGIDTIPPIYIHTAGKTGIVRKIPIVDRETIRTLCAWLAAYPEDVNETDNYVFINQFGHKLTPAAITMQLKRVAAAAGLPPGIHPHLIRHSRATHLLAAGMPESHLKLMMWGHLNTAMIDVYSHLTTRDIAKAMMDIQNIN